MNQGVNQPSVTLKRETHHDATVLSMYMDKDAALNAIAKKLGARWSNTRKMWWLTYDRHVVNTVFTAFKDVAWVDYSAL